MKQGLLIGRGGARSRTDIRVLFGEVLDLNARHRDKDRSAKHVDHRWDMGRLGRAHRDDLPALPRQPEQPQHADGQDEMR